MAKSFHDYLLEVEKEHTYKIKLALNDLDTKDVDRIEMHLRKYDVIDVQSPRKSIIQNHPIDFPHLTAVEVFTVEFTSKLPVSKDVLENEIKQLLKIPANQVVVRSGEDILDTQQDQVLAEPNTKSKLLDPDYKDAPKVKTEEYFGDKYNDNMIKNLSKLRKKKDITSGPTIQSDDTNKLSPLSKRLGAE